jgi:hypothetical protein
MEKEERLDGTHIKVVPPWEFVFHSLSIITMPNQTPNQVPRSSSRLAVKRKIQEEDELRLSNDNNHRPVAGGRAFRNDCGILPSE